MDLKTQPHEVCHEKTDLKVFVIVIPKEGRAHVAENFKNLRI